MADEVAKKLDEMFRERLKVEKYLKRLGSSDNIPTIPAVTDRIPNPFINIEDYKAFMARSDDHEFRQEYLSEFVEPEPKTRRLR